MEKLRKYEKNRKIEPKIQKPKPETEVDGYVTNDATANTVYMSAGQVYCILHKMNEDAGLGIHEILCICRIGNTGISENSLKKSTPNQTHPNQIHRKTMIMRTIWDKVNLMIQN